MAKKARKSAAQAANGSAKKSANLTDRDKKTLKDLVGLADRIVEDAQKKRDPYLDIPARSLSNVKYNKTKRFLELGRATNRRQLFNLSQAKASSSSKSPPACEGFSICSSTRSKACARKPSIPRMNAIR